MPKKRRRRKRKKIYDDIDWRELKKDDVVKIFQHSGTYELINDQKTCVGHNGLCTVHKVTELGFHAHNKHGHLFVYMGESHQNKNGTFMQPHKIKIKLKK